MRNSWHLHATMQEELRSGFSLCSGNESGAERRRRRGENRGQCKGKQPSRRDREIQWAFEAPPSAQKRFGPGPRISMQASSNPQCAASNRPDTRQHLTRSLELDTKRNPCRRGHPHTSTHESPSCVKKVFVEPECVYIYP